MRPWLLLIALVLALAGRQSAPGTGVSRDDSRLRTGTESQAVALVSAHRTNPLFAGSRASKRRPAGSGAAAIFTLVALPTLPAPFARRLPDFQDNHPAPLHDRRTPRVPRAPPFFA